MTELLKSGLRVRLRFDRQQRFNCHGDMDDVKQNQNGLVLDSKLGRKGNSPKRLSIEIYRAQDIADTEHWPLLPHQLRRLQGGPVLRSVSYAKAS
jgi:hypothetical protein